MSETPSAKHPGDPKQEGGHLTTPATLPGEAPCVLLRDPEGIGTNPGDWLLFRHPRRILTTRSLDEVPGLLEEVDGAVRRDQLWAAGFLTYESAPAFDPALEAQAPGELPLAWWALFDQPAETLKELPPKVWPSPPLSWTPRVSRSEYTQALQSIHRSIEAGDTYQVNFTFPLEAPFEGSAWDFFRDLCRAQKAPYGAFFDLGRFALCSASPELFFDLRDGLLRTRPMKGTAPRGRYPEEDEAHRKSLQESPKDRAENVMIVDMMRNDLGRVAKAGSVRVDELFTVETYPTVHQLTSTVQAQTEASFPEILRALFPCASITGAPKVSTSRIIRELEREPRGVYTGTLGFVGPQGASLNVAIRTATVDRERRTVRYGTGGGIVWDSEIDQEYEECRTKTRILRSPPPPFALLETLLWRPRSGYFLLERHLERLVASSRYFGYPVALERVRAELLAMEPEFAGTRQRVRLEVDGDGRVRISHQPWPCTGRTCWRIVLDPLPTDTSDPFLFHKTTHRRIYDEAYARRGTADEVVLWNENGELTETTRANLVLRIGDEWLTPKLSCGLLAGTYRAELLARGRLREAVLPIEMLDAASDVLLVNSLRGWIRTAHQASAPGVLPSAPGQSLQTAETVNP